MKKLTLLLCAATMLLFACNNETKNESTTGKDSGNVKKETASDEPWVPVDSATMMKNMMEYGTPGPMHQLMASWNGTWSGETTMWEYDGAAPQKSSGTAVNSMILGGKYQLSKHSGNMMGMPFEGQALMAYDNATKQFSSVWADTWSTGIMTMTGTWDDASKTMTLTGSSPDINRPGKMCHMKETFKVIDDKTQHMEMYGPDPKTGKEYKMFEIHMTKK
jgi:hypothetical protein